MMITRGCPSSENEVSVALYFKINDMFFLKKVLTDD